MNWPVLKKVLKYIGQYKWPTFLSFLLAGVTVALTLYVPVLAGNAIDQIATDKQDVRIYNINGIQVEKAQGAGAAVAGHGAAHPAEQDLLHVGQPVHQGRQLFLLLLGEFWIQCPENDVLNHCFIFYIVMMCKDRKNQ